jgi:hypothetical protein
MFLGFRLDGATAEVCAGFVLKGRGGRKGMATANLDAKNKVRYRRPAQETVVLISQLNFSYHHRRNLQLACPLGKDLKPSCRISSSRLVQMSDVTSTQSGSRPTP